MERKYHFLYKITNLVNQKYYIGVHNTDNLEDGYLGSGFAIQRALEKYGSSNFKIEKNDGRILNKVPKSIFKLREQETIILDKELNFYGIDEFGYLCKKGEFRKG